MPLDGVGADGRPNGLNKGGNGLDGAGKYQPGFGKQNDKLPDHQKYGDGNGGANGLLIFCGGSLKAVNHLFAPP